MVRLSVIIATYNRGWSLRRTLGSLAGQTLDAGEWEIIVVNNNSTDDTEVVCREFGEAHSGLNFRMVVEGRQGLSYARNAGIGSSGGEYIAIMDDDEEADKDFAKGWLEFFVRYPEAAVAGGQMVPRYDYTPPEWVSKYTEGPISGRFMHGERVKLLRHTYPIGGNMGFRRSAIGKYGAFNTELGRTGVRLLAGEEKDLVKRMRDAGGKVFYNPDAIIYHIIPQERFSDDYFDRVTKMIGVSERLRTLNESEKAYKKRLVAEIIKWEATLFLSAWYLLRFEPRKGKYLRRMRWNITKGLIDFE